ncbi:lactosylceramide 1,3-N-acetyl-beta-D-glucosaminyltransferase B [Corythoichthys intestinalis]|uniref:lactosylceramide 1,3-N-acetyl-beta-D-glucosaminyltransferase B n=1 Tax=Corythoichthys intestinalis TaxID=161448 RepID=UPI0025A6528F|nr:lactosylceramide 1,3-N-acetyl-beta-D-glucosaminyltransferase B [Corythoichthys intestinalis]XP_057713588.1 lactosylceramide 1,3-N-acetyl-beta-D-glucosaminyltransferase B [Corythoichthys intestinalis]XP_061794921.1 lactosylceramide 1,3-N-acetyl-beta-D-glucosaminyltransferase A-like [Nerophis lumbriciformis]
MWWRWRKKLLLCAGLLLWVLLHRDGHHAKSFLYRLLVNRFDDVVEGLTVPRERARAFTDFRPLLDHPDKCAGPDVFLLLFVKSPPRNADRRRAIRSTWGNERFFSEALGVTVKVVFALGAPDCDADVVQRRLLAEDRRYGDLIQRDFSDSFLNLTLKLIMQFQWARRRCPRARFLMLADDDVFVHAPNLVAYLREAQGRGGAADLWVGHVIRAAPPIRREDSKYYVPPELYRWDTYPDYTAGMGYLVSGDVAEKIYRASVTLDASFYVDDVFMGICAKAAGVSPRGHPYFSGGSKAIDHPCVYNRMITSHGHVGDLRRLWEAATDVRVREAASGLLDRFYCAAVRIFLFCGYPAHSYPCTAAFF